jgi:hypothetical protein
VSTDHPDREVIEEITTRAGREHARQEAAAREYQESSVPGVEITERFREFLRMAADGKLPKLEDPGEQHPDVALMAAELVVMHLPEWRNPAGRKLAEPVALSVPQAPRVAQYLIERGWRFHPEHETVRWTPTPGATSGPYDQGLHIQPDEHGEWPAPDPEQFYDFDDIKVEPMENGDWSATHPRGIAFQAKSKSEAYAGIVGRLRAKIEEAKQV